MAKVPKSFLYSKDCCYFCVVINLLQEHLRVNPYIPYWMLLIILIQIIVFSYIYLHSAHTLLIPFQFLLDKRVKREVLESKNSFQIRSLKLINIIYLLNFSILFYMFMLYNQKNTIDLFKQSPLNFFDKDEYWLFIYALTAVLTIVLLKKILFLMITHLFNEAERYNLFILNMEMFLKAWGTLMFPFIIMLLWSDNDYMYILKYLFILFIILYFLILLLSFSSLPQKTYLDYINFILYLCALEIIPLLLLLKYSSLIINS